MSSDVCASIKYMTTKKQEKRTPEQKSPSDRAIADKFLGDLFELFPGSDPECHTLTWENNKDSLWRMGMMKALLLQVDNFGTVNLVEACRKLGVNRFILISSILVNGAAMGQLLNPAYIFLNVFGLTLVAKLQAEQHIRRSGINFTIVRPGGLRNEPPKGNIVMEPEDTLYEGSISRDQVAEVAVEALNHAESSYKVVEIVAREDAPKRSFEELFGSIKQR